MKKHSAHLMTVTGASILLGCAALLAAAPAAIAQDYGDAAKKLKQTAQDYGDAAKKKLKQAAEDQGGMNAEMEAWIKAGTPSENHKRLSPIIGSWTATAKQFSPAGEPMTTYGKCTNEWIMDGRYVLTKYDGEMMGQPFEGMAIAGYDNLDQKYFSIWIDSMSTGHSKDYGTYDESTSTFSYKGSFNAPGGTMYSKSTLKIVDENTHVLTMWYGMSKAQLQKNMEITYERADKLSSAAAYNVKTVEAGCAMCSYHMAGANGCSLAVKIDGKPYLVEGADVSAHKAGLCAGTKKAKVAGKIKGDKFLASSFELE